jgi:hypothetical protein
VTGDLPDVPLTDEGWLRLLSTRPYDSRRARLDLPGVRRRVEEQTAAHNGLVERGWARRDKNGVFHLTPKGKKLLADLHQRRLDIQRERVGQHADLVRGVDVTGREGLAARILTDVRADPEYVERHDGETQQTGDMLARRLAEETGHGGLPMIVTPADFDAMRRRGDIERTLYRGVDDGNFQMPAAEIHLQYRVGRYHAGLGTFGNGQYMAVSRKHASEYGTVARFGLRRDARIIEWDDLVRDYMAWWDAHGRDESSPEWNVYGDPGRWAMAHGYDGIFVPAGTSPGLGRPAGDDQYVILNRTAVVTEVPNGT